ncbi:Spx/MgsR family RNA polymerase-binding regulatory protein [Anaerobacillus alkaliphilus]|uniref:Spx/MgsR family RNA polymerase-binding regulatory protein n=1 Tax=Anaerobacillus alkaliphilus TaxID=1548597 RepID=A0A4Q0VYI2_9BACI|nr:transcriptional regulator Spx [Anaerobacillus alkaliphilus]RXJ04158.1 Spx/MgsR family RNA polymerase-binding regulatory protein [Anaerobacillus alkaliphilus]
MITIYTTPGCSSSRKAKAWLKEHNIEFVERNMLTHRPSVAEIKTMVGKTEDGVDEIISTRSQIFKKLGLDLETLSIQKLFKVVSENPCFLRSPIIVDEKRLLAGFSEIEIRRFLPRKTRKFYLQQAQLLVN